LFCAFRKRNEAENVSEEGEGTKGVVAVDKRWSTQTSVALCAGPTFKRPK